MKEPPTNADGPSRGLLRPCFARLLALLVGQPDRSATGAFPLHCFALFNHDQVTPFIVFIAAFGRFMRRSRIPKYFYRHMQSR